MAQFRGINSLIVKCLAPIMYTRRSAEDTVREGKEKFSECDELNEWSLDYEYTNPQRCLYCTVMAVGFFSVFQWEVHTLYRLTTI